jgi:hypothetical protein
MNFYNRQRYVVLKGARGEIRLREELWRNAIKLAQQYGWRPVGTLPPPEEGSDWEGGYVMPPSDFLKEQGRAMCLPLQSSHRRMVRW